MKHLLSGLIAVVLLGFTIPTSIAKEEDDTEFSIAVLPDTQFYTPGEQGGNNDMFVAQINWIRKNVKTANIKFVIQLGDLVQTGERKPGEWVNASRDLYMLEEPLPGFPNGIPYGACVGNHDQQPGQRSIRSSTSLYNKYFGIGHFKDKPWYGGHYGEDNDCHYDLFSAAGLDFVIIYVEYDMLDDNQDGMNKWVCDVLEKNRDRKAIVCSYAVVQNNRKFGTNEKAFPDFAKQGQRLYDRIKFYPNLFMMLGGHVGGPSGEGYRQDFYAGSCIKSMLTDYQGRKNGGNGMMRLIKFSRKNDRLTMRTFSPYANEEEMDGDSHFSTPWFVNTNGSRLYDFDNDRHSEIMWVNDGNWKLNGGATTIYGAAGDIPAPADYNGDGQTDIAFFRPAGGKFYIQGKDTITIGQAGDIPVHGDYDGDGKTDFNVFRPSTGEWILHGRTPKTCKLGQVGDIPVAGNYGTGNLSTPAVLRNGHPILPDGSIAVDATPAGYGVVNLPCGVRSLLLSKP